MKRHNADEGRCRALWRAGAMRGATVDPALPVLSGSNNTEVMGGVASVPGFGARSAENGSSGHLTEAAGSQEKPGFQFRVALAPDRVRVCIVSITRLMPSMHQPDPPGLMYDGPRLLPPWRGSSLLWAK